MDYVDFVVAPGWIKVTPWLKHAETHETYSLPWARPPLFLRSTIPKKPCIDETHRLVIDLSSACHRFSLLLCKSNPMHRPLICLGCVFAGEWPKCMSLNGWLDEGHTMPNRKVRSTARFGSLWAISRSFLDFLSASQTDGSRFHQRY